MRSEWIFSAVLPALLWAVPASADEVIYIGRGSAWRYFRGLGEASSPDPAAWREIGFDDGAWATGNAPFGYGDPPFGTDLSALSPPMRSNYTTLFLRRRFEAPDPGRISKLYVNLDYDDGFVLWINGVEVMRRNVDDPLAFDRVASRSHESGTYEIVEFADPPSILVPGTNVAAVQVFNRSLTSSDLKFDMDLLDPFGPDLTPPRVESLVPAAGATVRRLAQIEVTFSEEVTGVEASDLRVGGAPAERVTGLGRGPYVFGFDEPPPGTVEVAWADGHGIADAADPPNAFAGGAWSYTVDPTAPRANLVITEFLAANRTGLQDEDEDTSDWIEVRNEGAETADLGGWALTDDPDEPGRWTFPSMLLGPGEYLVVFASGKDRRPTDGRSLHTNFKLNADGEFLGLYAPESPRQAATVFSPSFPLQRADFSYGFTGTGEPAYFDPPTPRRANGSALALSGIVADPKFSPPRGFYEDRVLVEIFSTTPGAEVYYTLDGTEPTQARGTPYAGPVEAAAEGGKPAATIRAVAFKPGYLPSRVVTHTYIFVASVPDQPPNPAGFPTRWGSAPAVDYGMDPEIVGDPDYHDLILEGLLSVPTLSIVMDVKDMFGSGGIYSNPTGKYVRWERPASVELIHPDGRGGFQVNCGIRIQGGASRQPNKSPKHAFRLLFKGDYGPSKLRYPFFPDSRVSTFDTITLRANYNNSWIHWDSGQRRRGSTIRDQWARDTQLAMGRLSSHGRHMHVYVNGLYWGLYNPVERPTAPFAAAYLGGEKEEYDSLNSGSVRDGDRIAWNTMMGLARAGLGSLGQYEKIQDYLDVPSFIDYMIMNIYGGNDDWPHHNWYAFRRRAPGAPFEFVSWDAERILEGVSVNKSGVSNSDCPGELYARLRANPEFRVLFGDRVHSHFFQGGALTPEAAAERWMARARVIDAAVACESARWGDYRRDVHSWSNGPYELYTRNRHWLVEQARLLNTYFPRRSQVILAQLKAIGLYPDIGAPIFSRQGGTIDPDFTLTMTLPAGTDGTIYYTTDGSDPRLYGSGDIAPTASAYAGPVALGDTVTVRARTWSAGEWSALEEALFTIATPRESLCVSEIMYHPPGGGTYEYIELENAGAYTIDLVGLYFSNGIEFVFSGRTPLGPGEYLVLVSDPEAFASRYPDVPIAGAYEGRLADGGEKVTLKDADGETVVSVDYDDERFWPIGPDGFGHSLVLANPAGDPDDPANWRASARALGSPGGEDPPPLHGGVVINEILTHAGAPLEDAIELRNAGDRTADIGGWYLSDSREDEASLRKFRIPDGTAIPPGGYAVFYAYQFDPEPGAWPSFDLPEAGGAVYLAAADEAGVLTGYIVGHEFRAAEENVSFGRYETSVGPDFTALQAPSFGASDPATVEAFRTGGGAPNGMPRVGPVVINEIHYHPLVGDEEFLELHNLTGDAIGLDGWRLHGLRNAEQTEDFAFSAGTEIPGGGYLLVVGIDPDLFRSLYAVPAATPIVGPSGGALENAGERLKLLRPSGAGTDARIVVDEVRYNDKVPWPVEADGEGPSLERVRAGDYPNDPINWAASLEAGGTPGEANSVVGPGVNQRPIASFAIALGPEPLTARFDASGSGDPDGVIVRFAWDFGDGSTGEGRAVTHAFPAASTYTVILTVTDDDAATFSAVRSVTLSEPEPGGGQIPGDGNQDGVLDLGDAIVLLSRLFLDVARPLPCEGATVAEGGNGTLMDVNGDEGIDLGDAIYLLNYLFAGGPEPALGRGCVRIVGCPDVCAP